MKIKTILLCFFFSFQLSAQHLPPDFNKEVVRNDFDFAMGLVFDEIGNMYVWEKGGRVWVIDSLGNRLPEPLIDIHEEVADWRDHGLMSFALDPDFRENGNMYLLYAVDKHYLLHYGTNQYHPDTTYTFVSSIGRLTRYTADVETDFTSTLYDTREILIGETIEDAFHFVHESHSLGHLLFGEDGTLLISSGDGNTNSGPDVGGDDYDAYYEDAFSTGILTDELDIGSYRAQSFLSPVGKILRIDPTSGEGLDSNPFYDANNPASTKSRTWARGFRNPFRMTIRPNTGSHYAGDGDPGTIYVGDVGSSSWEELNVVEHGGQNFGWPLREGLRGQWGFYNQETPVDILSPNPLFGVNGCTIEFFDFRDLLKARKEEGGLPFPNPCDANQEVPASLFPTEMVPPLIAWTHDEYNLPTRTEIGYFDDNGMWTITGLEAEDSYVEGKIFDGASSMGGVFYEGDNFPEEFRGKYLHPDFSGYWIRMFDVDENNALISVDTFDTWSFQPIHIEVSPFDGCLYSVHLGGRIERTCYGGNPRPLAVINMDENYGVSPLNVQFDASESTDPDGLPITYFWDFGEGNTSTEIAPLHTFNADSNDPQSFDVTLTVTDSLGAEGTAERVISLNNTPPEVEITSFQDGALYPVDKTFLLILDAEINDAEHSEDELEYLWEVFVHHNTHFHPEPKSTDKRSHTIISPIGCDGEVYYFRVRLTVTDAAGLSTTKEQSLFPNCGNSFTDLDPLNATAQEKTVLLNWKTLSENGVERFDIQRSSNYLDFEKIGETTSIGVSTSTQDYSFTDINPILGQNIYRLKMYHSDGRFDFSNMVAVDFPTRPAISIFPNPAQEEFTLRVENAKSELIELELFSTAGQRLIKSFYPAQIGQLLEQRVIIEGLPAGLYFYAVKNGEEELRGSLVVEL